VAPGPRAPRRGRDRRVGLALLGLTLYVACALWATWPAIRDVDGSRYLALPAAGHGEAAAGDHLQLGWAFWLFGHQLERGASPLDDPYSFRPLAEAPPNLQGWLLGLPFWPLGHLLGLVSAYNLLVVATFVLAGGATALWLRALGLGAGAALVGGVVFALMPYRVGQSTGHLLGLISFLLPAMLLALERRRVGWAALALLAIPLSGQLHLALGALPLLAGYAWARLPRADWRRAAVAAVAGLLAGLLAAWWAVAGSIGTHRSFRQTETFSAELSDFVTRAVGSGIEELVFLGWLTPLLATAGVVAARRRGRGLAWLLGLAAVVPCLLALGANNPAYEALWRVVPGLGTTRVPERLMPIACLALAALVALAVDRWGSRPVSGRHVALGPLVCAALVVALALDLRVPVFGAVAADGPSTAYAAIEGDGRLLELPVFRPAVHFGSVYLGYARQSPRERPQGYATLAEPAADRWARANEGLSCGRGTIPAWVGWVVVHGGLYDQADAFVPACRSAAEARLRGEGWRLVRRDGPIATWRAP
jgi:hypothetical protein